MNQEIQIVEAEALSEITKAEQQSQVDIAKQYPRNVQTIKNNLLVYAGADQETAKDCFYVKPVDEKGTTVEGPSVRLAEIMTAVYQNIRSGSRVVEVGQKWVKVQGFCLDVENNNFHLLDEQRSIVTKTGHRYSQNMIQNTIKAAAAIAVRNAIFKVVPPALFSGEIAQIKAIATGAKSADGKVKPLMERFEKAVKTFRNLGIPEDRIYSTLNIKRKDDVVEHHLEQLVGLHTAIKDKEITLDEAFPPTKKETKTEQGKSAVGNTKDMFNK